MNFFFSSRRRHTFFFQAEDGIRDRSPSRGLGDVYKRQGRNMSIIFDQGMLGFQVFAKDVEMERVVGKILIEFLYVSPGDIWRHS